MEKGRRTFFTAKIKLAFVFLLCLLIVGCGQSNEPPNEPVTVNGSSDNGSDQDNEDDDKPGQKPGISPPSGQGEKPAGIPISGDKPANSPIRDPKSLMPDENPPSQEPSVIVGTLLVKMNDMIVLFQDDALKESKLPMGEYYVYKVIPSTEHSGVNKYYISANQYVFIDDSNPDIVEYIPKNGDASNVIGVLIVKESDSIILFDDAAGTSSTVPAGEYNIIKILETPYPDTFQFFISESQYFYLNDVAEELTEYVENP